MDSRRPTAQPAGAWIDCNQSEESLKASPDTDLSYWSELGMCYEPEWFPLGGKLPAGS